MTSALFFQPFPPGSPSRKPKRIDGHAHSAGTLRKRIQPLFKVSCLSIFIAVMPVFGCGSNQAVTGSENAPIIVQNSPGNPSGNSPSANPDSDNPVSNPELFELVYENKTSSLKIPVSLRENFQLKLSGAPPQLDDDAIDLNHPRIREERARAVQETLKTFRQAQELFYREDFSEAMRMVDRSLSIQETADGLGLKGTIFFMLDNSDQARYFWNRAVRLDPEISMPNIPELESIIEDIMQEDN